MAKKKMAAKSRPKGKRVGRPFTPAVLCKRPHRKSPKASKTKK